MIEPLTALVTGAAALYAVFTAVETAANTADRMIETGMDVWTESHMLGLTAPLKLRSKSERTIVHGWNVQMAEALGVDVSRIARLTQREAEDAVLLTACVRQWALKGWAGHPKVPGVLAEAAKIIQDWDYLERARALQVFDLEAAVAARGKR